MTVLYHITDSCNYRYQYGHNKNNMFATPMDKRCEFLFIYIYINMYLYNGPINLLCYDTSAMLSCRLAFLSLSLSLSLSMYVYICTPHITLITTRFVSWVDPSEEEVDRLEEIHDVSIYYSSIITRGRKCTLYICTRVCVNVCVKHLSPLNRRSACSVVKLTG